MEQDTNTRPAGRTFISDVLGNTTDAIEMAALDAAREFFGGDLDLEVVRDYRVWPNTAPNKHPDCVKGRYRAAVAVRVIEDPS